MPDWLSHIVIALIIVEIFNIRKKSLVMLGALLPDIPSKLGMLFFYFHMPKLFDLGAFHTPLVASVLILLIAPFFRYQRLKTIIFMSIGLLSHFVLDMTQKHFISGIPLFFPVSTKAFLLNWFWPEQAAFIFLVSGLMFYFLIRVVKKSYSWG